MTVHRTGHVARSPFAAPVLMAPHSHAMVSAMLLLSAQTLGSKHRLLQLQAWLIQMHPASHPPQRIFATSTGTFLPSQISMRRQVNGYRQLLLLLTSCCCLEDG